MAIYLIVIIMKITALVSQAKGRLFFCQACNQRSSESLVAVLLLHPIAYPRPNELKINRQTHTSADSTLHLLYQFYAFHAILLYIFKIYCLSKNKRIIFYIFSNTAIGVSNCSNFSFRISSSGTSLMYHRA